MAKTLLRSLQGFALVSAVALLTGAKGQGCGGGGETGSDTGGSTSSGTPPISCGPGTHVDQVCDGMDDCDPNGCHDACVPDACPDGSGPIWTCDPGYPVPADDGNEPSCNAPDCPPPPDGDCKYVCGPISYCGPGFHEEEICSGDGAGGGSVGVSVGAGGSGQGGWAYPDKRSHGHHPGGNQSSPPDGVGGGSSPGNPTGGTGGGNPKDPGCWVECVPDSFCPPGTIEVTECDGGSGGGVAHPDLCQIICVPESTSSTGVGGYQPI